MEPLLNELLKILGPALRSRAKAKMILVKYWADKIALIWTTEDIHRAANENETVLTETQARQLLGKLHDYHNAQYGLRWSDLADAVEQNGLGRDIKSKELDRFIHHDELTIDPPKKGQS